MSVPLLVSLFNLVSVPGSVAAEIPNEQDKIVTFFWGSWCSDCKEKMATSLKQIEQSKKASIITITMDKDLEKAKYVMDTRQIKFPVFSNPDKSLTKKLGVFAVPHWAVFKKKADNSWELVHSESGFNDGKVLETLKSAN